MALYQHSPIDFLAIFALKRLMRRVVTGTKNREARKSKARNRTAVPDLKRVTKRQTRASDKECLIPPPIPIEALSDLLVERPQNADDIASYVEWQSPGEKVMHAELVTTEHVFGEKHECWDVRTNKSRLWVITGPTNLYDQSLFPSVDYALSFHIGVTARVRSRDKPRVSGLEQMTMPAAWRRWERAGVILNEAEEPEDFQSVGMRCRESLIAMVRALGLKQMVPKGSLPPQKSNVVEWCNFIANHVAQGSSAERMRGYLKAVAKAGWEFVNWLTHAQGATRADGLFALELTQHALAIFGTAAFRHRQGVPDRCEDCGSYRLGMWSPDPDMPLRPHCLACGWSKTEP